MNIRETNDFSDGSAARNGDTLLSRQFQRGQRIRCGKENYTSQANGLIANHRCRIGQVAVFPDGSEWLRVDGRKHRGTTLIRSTAL
jgi:hypothetical protein